MLRPSWARCKLRVCFGSHIKDVFSDSPLFDNPESVYFEDQRAHALET